MFSLMLRSVPATGLLKSQLHNEQTFYEAFLKDLRHCASEVLIESPFITYRRLANLFPILQRLKAHGVRVAVNTRDPQTHADEYMRVQALLAISTLQHMGVQVLFTSNHHRKLVVIDRQILYEGSLNVLSQNDSCEVMRRIESVALAWQMIGFIEIDKFLQ